MEKYLTTQISHLNEVNFQIEARSTITTLVALTNKWKQKQPMRSYQSEADRIRNELLSSNVMSAPLLASHLSTPLFLRPGNLHLAIKLAASLSEATTSGGFGSALLLRTSLA